MSVQNWSDSIIVADLQDDPQFTDDLVSVLEMVADDPNQSVVLDFKSVNVLNSSNIAKLLKLRKLVTVKSGRQLRLCGVNTHVWGIFLVTGLDKVFDFADELSIGLTSVQIDNV